MTCVPVRFDRHTVNLIDLIANHRRLSRSALIREIVGDYVSAKENLAVAFVRRVNDLACPTCGESDPTPEVTAQCSLCNPEILDQC
jgi:hypothetical protein